MAINSRAKGCRGERAWRDVLREAGYCARRGAQYSGHVEAPDVLCGDLDEIHFEVKCVEKLNVRKAVEQAIRDCKRAKYSVVAHKTNNAPWLVTMEARDFLDIVRRSDLPRVGPSPEQIRLRELSKAYLDAQGIPPSGKGKISIPVKR